MTSLDAIPGRLRTTAGLLEDLSVPEVPDLRRYWADPAPFEAERAREQAKINAQFNRVRDAGLRKAGLL